MSGNKQPNLLFLMADQHRYDCTGLAGRYPVSTPNLDRLGEEGAFFRNAYTPMPICAPARQCLASGRMADSFGGFWNYDMPGLPCKSFVCDGTSWTNRLQKNGYQTAFLGRWHASEQYTASDFGYSCVIGNDRWSKHVTEKYPDKQHTGGWMGEESFLDLEDSQTHFMAREACGLLQQFARSDRPFHLRLDFSDPHLPCRPSLPFARMFDPADVPPWDSFGDAFEGKPYIQKQMVMNWDNEQRTQWSDWNECVARYYGMIAQVDDAVGRILHTLEETGLAENTIVIYTADHGDTSGGHNMMDKHYVLYDDVTHVPLIIRWPGVTKPGTVVEDFTAHMLDLVPTIEEACGLGHNKTNQGLSLIPLLKGEAQPERAPFAVSSSNGQQFGFFCNRTIRTAEYRYVWNLTDVDELYHIPSDPGEKKNLAADPAYRETLQSLRRRLYQKLVELDDPFAKGWVAKQLTQDRKY